MKDAIIWWLFGAVIAAVLTTIIGLAAIGLYALTVGAVVIS